MKDKKRRRPFKIYRLRGIKRQLVGHGILYDEMNCQLLWRIDRGYTAEQVDNISQLIGFIPGANIIEVEDE